MKRHALRFFDLNSQEFKKYSPKDNRSFDFHFKIIRRV